MRLELGLSQSALADLLQMTRRSVNRMERGDQKIMHVTALAMRYLSIAQKTKERKRNT